MYFFIFSVKVEVDNVCPLLNKRDDVLYCFLSFWFLRLLYNFKGGLLTVSCEGNIVKLFIYTTQFCRYGGRQSIFGSYRDRIKGQRFSAYLLLDDGMQYQNT